MSKKSEIEILYQTGAAKLKEMSASSGIYADFLRFQGRVFKQNATVALEFFAQKPEAKYIANAKQWTAAGYKIKDGGEAIRFADSSGNHTDLYDFSQMESGSPPKTWIITKENAALFKTVLAIPADKPIIGGIISKVVNNAEITNCMKRLGVPPREFNKFGKAFVDAVQTITAGRLEIGGNRFNIKPDSTLFNSLDDMGKITFLTMARNTCCPILHFRLTFAVF